MNSRMPIACVVALWFAILGASCSSISQEQLTANEKSRVEQQRKGYFDRESSAQQRQADQRAEAERLRQRK